MRPFPVILVVALSVVIGGCAKPALKLAEPSDRQEFVAELALEKVELRASRNTPPWQMKPTIARVVGPVREAAFLACADLMARNVSDVECGAALTARIQLYSAEPDVNAFADQWNNIGILGGLVANMGTDEELAAVLAHEYSHIILGHVRKKLKNALAGALIAGVCVGLGQYQSGRHDPVEVENAMKVGALIGSRAYSPEMEIEADRLAIFIMKRAGYSTAAMGDVIIRLSRIAPRKGGLFGWFPKRVGFLQTHPSSKRRMAHILSAIDDAEAGALLKAADR